MNNPNEFIVHQKKDKQKFFEQLLENCYIDHLSGNFHCKKCKTIVHIDWYRNLAFCRSHIISAVGITHIEEIYKICLKNECKGEREYD